MTVMSKMVAMMAVRNGGDALGYGDDDGNDAMAVRLMTAMTAMTLWKRTVRDVPIPARVQVCDRQWRHRQTQQTCNTWLVIYRINLNPLSWYQFISFFLQLLKLFCVNWNSGIKLTPFSPFILSSQS